MLFPIKASGSVPFWWCSLCIICPGLSLWFMRCSSSAAAALAACCKSLHGMQMLPSSATLWHCRLNSCSCWYFQAHVKPVHLHVFFPILCTVLGFRGVSAGMSSFVSLAPSVIALCLFLPACALPSSLVGMRLFSALRCSASRLEMILCITSARVHSKAAIFFQLSRHSSSAAAVLFVQS